MPISPPPTPPITVSIVSHGQLELVLPLLDELDQFNRGIVAKLVLTLNIPEPDLLAGRTWGFEIERIENTAPKGFGANHNQAFARCTSPWFLVLNPDAQEQVLRALENVVSGRADVTARLRGRERSVLKAAARFAPVVRADNEASGRYTIVDIVASNALGLLYRISRVISQHGCEVDLVLIATEGEKAIDVFHITKAGVKLTQAEQQALTSDLQRTLEGSL